MARLSIKTKWALSGIVKKLKKKRFTSDYHNLTPLHYGLIRDQSSVTPNLNRKGRRPVVGLLNIAKITIFFARAPLMKAIIRQLEGTYKFVEEFILA